ncbi:MAG: DUF86 domain-containing protein [Candidatus Omnitrophica bacterium]|nr:DUF86 domain-containing protein [Candidatus Omnitrophota bacterium]
MREFRDHLYDIKNECEYFITRSRGINLDDFLKNEEFKRAFVRSLEIIGEASKKIPDSIKKKYSQIKWREIVAMRNKIIHEYFGVDYEIVWKVVKEKIPELYVIVQKIIEEVNKDG